MKFCLMCKKSCVGDFRTVESILRFSKKPAYEVLQHLANHLKVELNFFSNVILCFRCFVELKTYDKLMVELLNKQHTLMECVNRAMSYEMIETNKIRDAKTGLKIKPLRIYHDTYVIFVVCSLCCTSNTDSFKSMDNLVHVSRKPAYLVLQHLAFRLNKAPKFDPNGYLCNDCFSKINRYDFCMSKLLKHKKRLMQQLKKSLELPENNDSIQGGQSIRSESEREMAEPMEGIEYNHQEAIADVQNMAGALEESPKCICRNTFETEFKDNTNIVVALHKKKFNCGECGRGYSDEEHLALHLNLHDGRSDLECRLCDKTFTARSSTLRHLRGHFEKKMYQCEKCGKLFSLYYTLANHKQIHDAEEHPPTCVVGELPLETLDSVVKSVDDSDAMD